MEIASKSLNFQTLERKPWQLISFELLTHKTINQVRWTSLKWLANLVDLNQISWH